MTKQQTAAAVAETSPSRGARLAFKPHLRAHVISDQEVALLGEGTRHALRGKAYAVLAPLLDGSLDEDGILAAAGDSLAPEMVYYALGRLAAQGHTVEVPTEGLEAWQAWWLAQEATGIDQAVTPKDVTEKLDSVAAARVAITAFGVGEAVTEALAAKLQPGTTAGLTLVPEPALASLELCMVDDYLRPELAGRIRQAQAAGRALLPLRPLGQSIWVGPYCDGERSLDWPGFLARLRANRPADSAVLARGGSFPLLGDCSTPQSLDLALALVAQQLLRCAAGDPPPLLQDAIWTLDTASLETARHLLPAAGASTATKKKALSAQPIELPPTPKRYRADGGHRVCAPDESLARLEPLISPISGIVPDIEKLPTPPGIEVFGATQTMSTQRTSPQQNRLLGRPSAAVGKGQTAVQAKVSCLAEAVERYSCGLFPDVASHRATLAEMGPMALDPASFLLLSDKQYANREASNREKGLGFNWVPEPFDPEESIDWTPVWSLSHQRRRWLPSLACYYGYGSRLAPGARLFAGSDSNGCAAGNNLPEAILQGLLEVIERDTCALWWYNRVRRPALDLASFGDPFFDAMAEHYAGLGRSLEVLDLRNDLGVPAFMAVSWRLEDGARIHFGLGCHLEPRNGGLAGTQRTEPAGCGRRGGPRRSGGSSRAHGSAPRDVAGRDRPGEPALSQAAGGAHGSAPRRCRTSPATTSPKTSWRSSAGSATWATRPWCWTTAAPISTSPPPAWWCRACATSGSAWHRAASMMSRFR